MGRPRRSRVALCVWLGYWLAIFAATHVPVSAGPPIGRFTDKVIHFLLYFVLLVLGVRYWAARRGTTRRVLPRARTIVTLAAVLLVYAGFDEWSQQFVGRSTSATDFLADLTGLAAAAVILITRSRLRPIPFREQGTPLD